MVQQQMMIAGEVAAYLRCASLGSSRPDSLLRKKYGSANLDFDFRDAGGFQWNGQCIVTRRLPYTTKHIRTGQFQTVAGGYDQLWDAEVLMSPDHEGDRQGQAVKRGVRTR